MAEVDLAAQGHIFQSWLPQQPSEKLTIIRELLLLLAYNEILPERVNLVVNPVLLCVPDQDRSKVVAGFNRRAAAHGIRLTEFWGEMMAFWRDCPETSTDAALLMH